MPGISPVRSSMRRPAASSARLRRPAGPELLRVLPGILHDLRGPGTAIGAFSTLLGEHCRSKLDEPSAFLLAGVAANAELLTHLCDCLAVLDGTGVRSRAPLAEIAGSPAVRLQKFLARSHVALKPPGEFPDREFERHRLGIVLEALVIATTSATGVERPMNVSMFATEECGSVSMSVAFDSGAGRGVREALESFRSRVRGESAGAGLPELAVRAALGDLGGDLTVRRGPGTCATAILALPLQPSGRRSA